MAIEIISQSDEIIAKLEKEGKVKTLDSLQDFQAMETMNEGLAEVRRDYKWMNGQSEIGAGKAYITA